MTKRATLTLALSTALALAGPSAWARAPAEGIVYLDGWQAVLYRSRINPTLGRNFEAMDSLEWLARMSDHIPDPGQHRMLFHGE